MDSADDLAARAAARTSMFLKGTLRLGRLVREVRVRNLSAGGALVDCEVDVPLGTSVSLELRNIGIVRGKTAWLGGGKMGLKFDSPIDPDAARVPVSAAVVPERPVFRRPGIALPSPVTEKDFKTALGWHQGGGSR